MTYKGIILAGGAGTRLYPATLAISKQLLPVFDKPMIYYPLSILMLAGIREILIISTQQDLPRFRQLLGDGSALGLSLQYKVQEQPLGIAHAFIVAEEFLAGANAMLVLGDNILYGNNFSQILNKALSRTQGASIFLHTVTDPERYGVAELAPDRSIIRITEKPAQPKSNYAVIGLYCYDSQVVEFAKTLVPSARGELEITALNNIYLAQGQLSAEILGRGYAWFDTGTHESLLAATQFIATIEKRQGLKVACIEEIAWRHNWINDEQLAKLAMALGNNSYSKYLLGVKV